MKTTNLKPLLASLVAVLMAVSLSAHDVEIDGIYYNLNNETQEAAVTYKGSFLNSYKGEYSGSVTIPTSITSGDITYKVTSIRSSAFYDCSGLTSVTIPESVTYIGTSAFYNCTSMISLTIPKGVSFETSYGSNPPFYGCTGELIINCGIPLPWSVSGNNGNPTGMWLLWRSKFSSVKVNSNRSIPQYAFRECSTIESVEISGSVTSIGERAFYGCSGLTSLTIPESVTSIGNYAFSGCTGLTKAEFASIEQLCGIKFYDSASNPLYYAHHLHINGEEVTEAVIPDGVTSIGNYAFSGCSGLTSLTIPESVMSIGNYAFYGCSGLTSLTIPESVTSIGNYAFYGCTELTAPVYNKKLFAFMPKSYQGDYVIPDGIETICGGAFSGCTGLTSLAIPQSVTSIGISAFKDCVGNLILNCDIPDGTYDSYPMRSSKFTSVTVNGKSLGNYAFYDCSTIESVEIGESMTSIGSWAFSGCTGLTKAEFASVEQLCGINFVNSSSNPLSYAHHLYIKGEEVTELVIPESVDSIGDYAFSNCTGLSSLTIPESVTTIGSYAFSGCSGIKTVNALSATPPTAAANSFDGVSGTAFLYVPIGCEEAYGTAEGWKQFAKIREKDFGTKDCLLTLKGFNGGCVALKCKTRSTYAFQIHAEEGWKVSSLTFNGADATASIAADGSFTTPSLTDDAELCVVFEAEGSAVGELSTEDVLRVSASGSVLNIQNEGEAVPATVYTTDGKQVKVVEAKRGTTQVRLAEGQVYLVNVSGRTFKVAL